jgi:hypothetical protein
VSNTGQIFGDIKGFSGVSRVQVGIFISHCLTEEVNTYIKKKAQVLNFSPSLVFLVGGGTEVLQEVKEKSLKGAIGFACQKEILQALNSLAIPAIGISIQILGKCSQKKNLIPRKKIDKFLTEVSQKLNP